METKTMTPKTRTRRPRTNALLAIGYVRVSTSEQHLGPQAQRDAIAAWAGANGATIVRWCEDLGISGAARLEDRPGLRCVLDGVETLRAGLVVVAKNDRLSRDSDLAGYVRYRLGELGARIVSADGVGNGAETGDEGALVHRSVETLVAELEREKIRKRTRAALAVKRARGERVSRHVPFGFRLAADGVHLEQDPAEQCAIVRARALRAEGKALRAIGTALDAEGFRPRTSAWYPGTIRRMVGE